MGNLGSLIPIEGYLIGDILLLNSMYTLKQLRFCTLMSLVPLSFDLPCKTAKLLKGCWLKIYHE